MLRYIANPVLTGFTLPKLLWVRDNEPQNFERARKMLLPKDYVRFRLTGEFASEVSDASGTAVFDVVNRRWSYEMMDALGTRPRAAARVLRIERSHGQDLGGGGGTDRARGGNAGGGRRRRSGVQRGGQRHRRSRGSCPARWGRRAWCSRTWRRWRTIPPGRVHTFCHAVRGQVARHGRDAGRGAEPAVVPQSAGARRRLTMRSRPRPPQAPAGAQGLFWLPYLMGERTPHLDATARGGWIGLTASHTRADLIRSVIEGVSYSQRDCLDIIEELGVPVNSVRASGGGAQSPFWRQMLADILDKRVVTLETQEGSAYGAALLAMVGTGEYGSVPEVCRAAIHEVESVEPQPAAAEFYRRGHAIYQSLYPALRPFYGSLTNL